MTDPMDDLRQASADVSGVQILSPAAQAVLDAANQAYDQAATVAQGTAAALRAVAIYSYCPVDRRILMTIADELEGQGQLTKESD